jgi:hypothetical protein
MNTFHSNTPFKAASQPIRSRVAGLLQLLRRRSIPHVMEPVEQFVQLELGLPEERSSRSKRR